MLFAIQVSQVMDILQSNNATKLSLDDLKNICIDYQNGMSRNNIQKKYSIGGNRIAKILNANNITKNSKYIIRDAPNWQMESSNQNNRQSRNCLSNQSNSEESNPSDIDQLLTKQIENMKKNIDNIKFKSFIE